LPDNIESLLDRVCELIAAAADTRRIADARRRDGAVMAGREADYLPIAFAAPLPEEARDWPGFDWHERFFDPAKSLFMQLREMVLPRVLGGGDYVPGVRADMGTINCQSVFGVEWRVTRENRSAVTRYVPKDVLAHFESPEDVRGMGVIPQMVEHMAHHAAALADRGLGGIVSVHHCDQQGPFDIAAMVRGHDIFVDMHDDGDFVHRLMRACTEVYVKVTELCKAVSGERVGGPGNAVGVWMDAGAVRMCGDSDILVGAPAYREFIQPYQREAFDRLGGGWLHYCGGWPGTGRSEGLHLHDAYAEIGSLRGLNWTTARDWLGEMRKLRRLGVVHVGTVPRLAGEGLADYFRRVLSCYERRSGLVFGGTWDGPELRAGEHARAVETWHRVQDEMLP